MKRKNLINKEQIKVLVFLLVVMAAIVGLVMSIAKKIGGELDKKGYPASTLSETIKEFENEKISEMLPLKVSFPSLTFQICLPEHISSVNQKIVGSIEEIDFVIYESVEDMEKMIQSILPNALNMSVLGQSHDVNIKVHDTGYFYSYATEYVAMSVTTQISIRKVTTYAVVYRLMVTPESSIYIYISTEAKELLPTAKDLLDKIAYSVRPFSLEQADELDVKQKIDSSVESQPLSISLEKDALFPMENGVFLFEWMNADVCPDNLSVYAPDGKELKLIEDYSTNGHYVYEIGTMESGTYFIKGTTQNQISGVVMSIYEWDYYYEQFISFGFEE